MITKVCFFFVWIWTLQTIPEADIVKEVRCVFERINRAIATKYPKKRSKKRAQVDQSAPCMPCSPHGSPVSEIFLFAEIDSASSRIRGSPPLPPSEDQSIRYHIWYLVVNLLFYQTLIILPHPLLPSLGLSLNHKLRNDPLHLPPFYRTLKVDDLFRTLHIVAKLEQACSGDCWGAGSQGDRLVPKSYLLGSSRELGC